MPGLEVLRGVDGPAAMRLLGWQNVLPLPLSLIRCLDQRGGGSVERRRPFAVCSDGDGAEGSGEGVIGSSPLTNAAPLLILGPLMWDETPFSLLSANPDPAA